MAWRIICSTPISISSGMALAAKSVDAVVGNIRISIEHCFGLWAILAVARSAAVVIYADAFNGHDDVGGIALRRCIAFR